MAEPSSASKAGRRPAGGLSAPSHGPPVRDSLNRRRLAAREGAALAVVDLASEAAERVAGEARAAGASALALAVDARGTASVRAAVAAAVAELGRVDGLFHTAMSVPLVNE